MRNKLYVLLGTVLACTFIVFACGESEVNLTGPTNDSSTSQPGIFDQSNTDNDSGDQSSDDESEGPVNAAEGKLIIRGSYGECRQTTNFPRNYMSIFRVLDGRAQTRIELYKSGEGAIPCGFEIQIDCTVRDSDPTARPSAYDLYDHTIDTFACRPEPPCVNCGPKKCVEDDVPLPEHGSNDICVFDPEKCEWNCDPQCIPEWEVISREISNEGEWSECVESPPRGEFKQWRWVTLTITQGNQCNEETRENSRRHRETRHCEPECEPGEEEVTNVRTFFEGECDERVEVTITEYTDLCTGETRQERTEEPAPEHCACEPEGENPGQSCDADGGGTICRWDDTPEICDWVCVPDETCEPPQACIYEYGGPPADKEALCLALDNSAFWSDGSQHCVIPLPGVSEDKWNLTPGQSHPDCLRKQDD